MPPTPAEEPDAAAAGARDLASLEERVKAMRTVLARLLQEVVVAERRLSTDEAGMLLEANEALVVASMREQEAADSAALALDDAVRLAEVDALTGLPNRVLLLDRFAQAIVAARRHGSRLGLLFVDLDDFKQVNDLHGHSVGDLVLQAAARRLVAAVRDADTVSRHGGDEFLVLLSELAQPADARLIAAKLAAALGEPLVVGELTLSLRASIGISLYPDHGDEVRVLIERADAAMYVAKRRGGGGHAQHGEVAAVRPPAATEPPMSDPQRRHEELREANEQLVLAALGAQQLQAAAQQALQRQADFMALAAQELASPMTPIRLATAMLGRVRTDEPLLPRARSIIEHQVEQMTRLVGAVQTVAQAQAASFKLDRRSIGLEGVVAAAVGSSMPAFDARHQVLKVVLPPDEVRVLGDSPRLAQALRVLLDNASKYSHDHGTVELSVAPAGEAVTITVSDDGIGISALALPGIFEPFSQDIHAIGFNGIGAGVGLAVARALVDTHGGQIAAMSDGIGRGSRFVITLPREPAEA